jgi:predicted alpha/beta-fold hydrolase
VAFQDRKAPLVFLIAGTGGSSKSAKIVALMANLYQAGFHVIALPSPTFPNFIIDASTSHVPGNLSDDAVDLYRVMEKIWSQTKGRIQVSDFLLAGYSLGGTEADLTYGEYKRLLENPERWDKLNITVDRSGLRFMLLVSFPSKYLIRNKIIGAHLRC